MRALLLVFALLAAVRSEYVELVDTTIGTGGVGYGIGSVPVGAQRPFGMVRVGPDTQDPDGADSWNHYGGYYYPDTQIRCFSHTHMDGSGVLDLGNIGIMPVGEVTPLTVTDYGYKSDFLHDNETTIAGYYAVTLESYGGIRAEVTAGMYSAAHRYTFQPNTPAYIILDAGHALQAKMVTNATVNVTSDAITGWQLSYGYFGQGIGGILIYYAVKFGSTPAMVGTFADGKLCPHESYQNNPVSGAYAYFGTSSEATSVEVFVGISFVSEAQAMINLEAEMGSGGAGWSFDAALATTSAIWEEQLSRVQVTGGTQDELVTFYTALYHTLLAPTTFSEVGGYYKGFDKQIHLLSGGAQAYYTDMSIWDAYRTEFPWLTFFRPDVAIDIARSIVDMGVIQGSLPKWPFCTGDTGCMTGEYVDTVLVDMYMKGLTQFDAQAAYTLMKATALAIPDFTEQGYITYQEKGTHNAASLTLDYAVAMQSISSLATALNMTTDAAVFAQYAKNYKNVWDADKKFFCPRVANASSAACSHGLNDPFSQEYTEGDAWQYRFYVPHDVEGCIDLFGSDETFTTELDTLFELSLLDPSNFLPNPYYWAGNEPDILSAYEFIFSGAPQLTQKWVRNVLVNKYPPTPEGIPGNDDYGTMSAWVVWSMLGVYPLATTTSYALGSPVFTSATITVPATDVAGAYNLTVIAHGASDENIYVQSIALNGTPLDGYFIEHSDLIAGNAVLEFTMGPSPPADLAKADALRRASRKAPRVMHVIN